MVNSPNTCDCNDYSHQSANTGLLNIATGSQSLSDPTGSGNVPVLTASGGKNGAIIKSIIIKATQPTTTGMIRLFIYDGTTYALYKEVPVPINPVLAATPTPPIVLPMFEMMLEGGFELKPGNSLWASCSNSESCNIIAQGVEWVYPTIAPIASTPACCTYLNKTATNGVGVVKTANPNLDGTGSVNIFTAAGTNGTIIKNIVIKAQQSTHPGMVRLFINDGSGNYYLFKEIQIPETTQSNSMPSFKQVVPVDFFLHSGLIISASTEVGEGFAITVEATDIKYM